MTTDPLGKRPPYHHGALRQALVDAGVELARRGGPQAVVLREVARRIGVSPNAAYRHFKALPELQDAVADAALGALARAMEAELDAVGETSDAQAAAIGRLLAVGRGYVHFALAEPGLFATAFSRKKAGIGTTAEPGSSGRSAADLLQQALDGLSDAGLLAERDRDGAVITAWAGVHGLSTLLLGPLGQLSPEDAELMIDASMNLVCQGLIKR